MPVRFYPIDSPADPSRVVGNAAKAKSLLGWQPEITFEATIAEMTQAEVSALKRR